MDYRREFSKLLGEVVQSGKNKVSTRCPLHEDEHASLAINLESGWWTCYAGCGKGKFNKLKKLLKGQPVEPETDEGMGISEDLIRAWHDALVKERRLDDLGKTRGWTREIIDHYLIGWNGHRLTIPVRDESGSVVDVRLYAPGGKPKVVSLGEGRGVHLFPFDQLSGDRPIVICEGEPDVLCARSVGLRAVSSTGGASNWRDEWNEAFKGATVIVAYDNDDPGRKGGRGVASRLALHANEVRVVVWPDGFPSAGDVTDFLTTGGTAEDLIALAGRPVAATSIGGVDLAVNEETLGYERRAGDGSFIPISSFILRPTSIIDDPDGGPQRWRVDWEGFNSTGKVKKESAVLGNKFFSNLRDIRESLPMTSFWWTGNDRDLQALRVLLSTTDAPHVKGLNFAGSIRDGGRPAYILPGGMLGAEGWIKDPEWVYAPNDPRDLLTTSFMHSPIDLQTGEERRELVRAISRELPHLHSPNVVAPILGWMSACPFAEEIRQRVGGFPLLCVHGTQGSGKSETVGVFLRMMGWNYGRGEMNTVGHTRFVLLRMLASTSILPIAFDEWRVTDRDTDLSRRRLREVYNGGFDDRGRPDLTVTSFRLRAPVALVGETAPEDPATRERTVLVSMPPADPKRKVHLNALYASALRGWLYPYLQFTLRESSGLTTRFEDALTKADALIKRIFSPKALIPSRVAAAAAVVIMGIHLARDFVDDMGGDAKVFSDDWIREGVTSMVKLLVPVVGARPKVGLDVLIKEGAEMAEAGFILRGKEWEFDEVSGLVLLRLDLCVSRLHEWVRRGYPGDPLTKDAYRTMAEESMVRDGYVSSLKFEAHGKRWLAIDKSKAERAGLDLCGYDTGYGREGDDGGDA